MVLESLLFNQGIKQSGVHLFWARPCTRHLLTTMASGTWWLPSHRVGLMWENEWATRLISPQSPSSAVSSADGWAKSAQETSNRYFLQSLNMRQLLPRCGIRRLFLISAGPEQQEESPALPIREGILMRVFNWRVQFMQIASIIYKAVKKCCDIHGDINCDEGGDGAWWKQIKDLYPRLKGSSCYSNRAIHHKGASVPGRRTDALLSWC